MAKPDATTYALLNDLQKVKATCAAKHAELLDSVRKKLSRGERHVLDVQLAILTAQADEATTRLLADLRKVQ